MAALKCLVGSSEGGFKRKINVSLGCNVRGLQQNLQPVTSKTAQKWPETSPRCSGDCGAHTFLIYSIYSNMPLYHLN